MEPASAAYTDMPCPKCGRALRVRQEYYGRTIACKFCNQTFKAPGTPTTPAPLSEVDSLKQRLATLERDLQKSRNDAATNNARLESAVAQFQNAQNRLKDMQTVLDQAQQAKRQVETLQARLDAALAERDSLQARIRELEARAAQAEEAEKRLLEEVQQLRLHAEAGELQRRRADDLAGQLELARSEAVQTLETAQRQWETQRQDLELQWRSRLEEQEKNLREAFERERAAAPQTPALTGDNREPPAQLDAERERLEQDRKSLLAELAKVRNELSTLRRTFQDLGIYVEPGA